MPEPDWTVRTLKIATPENVEFAYELAGPGLRFTAWLIDHLILIGATALLFLFGGFLVFVLAGIGTMIAMTAVFVLWQGYFFVFEAAWHGQTPGKRLAHIRVMDERGFRVTWGQSLVRNLLRGVDGLPLFYAVAGIVSTLHRRGSRLGDIAAGTVVIKAARPIAPARIVPEAERYEPLLKDFELCERVRRRLKSPERDLLGALALRRERLEDADRMELFADAARRFEERLEVRRPDFVSPERFVLNLCAIAYMPRERATAVRRR